VPGDAAPCVSDDLIIRPAVPGEHRLAADVMVEARARAEIDGTMPPGCHGPEAVEAWMRDVVLPDREVYVATADEQAVGLLVLDTAWLDQLHVRPTWWRRGVATTLLSLAKALRPHGFGLWVFEVNTPARRLYERGGLVVVRRTDGRDNEERAPDVAYAWQPPGGARLADD
jgi:GNAT superfamily N-acetyltransferase